MPVTIIIAVITCFALVGILLYLPMRMAGLT